MERFDWSALRQVLFSDFFQIFLHFFFWNLFWNFSWNFFLTFRDGNIIRRERFCAFGDCAGSPIEIEKNSGFECDENEKKSLKWTKWALGECTRPCGGGNWMHVRTCIKPPCSGQAEKVSQYKCNTQQCHRDVKICSKSCGGGVFSIKKQCLDYDEGIHHFVLFFLEFF